MKNLLVLLLLVATICCFSACTEDRVTGSRNLITDNRIDGTPFSDITVRDAFEVTIRQGAEHAVTITADDNVLDRITTTVRNGNLLVEVNGNQNFRNVTLQADITTPDLTRLELNDAIRAELVDFTTNETLTIALNDATKLEATGSAPTLELNVNDASKLDGFGFTATECNARVNDASRVELRVTDRLTGSVNDASTFRYRGNPELDITAQDASRVVDAN
ncbi:MAG: DUF2807 domain-containing protein [Bacteroidota bacterium]